MWGISSIVDAVQEVADDVIDVASDVVDKAQDVNPLSSVADVMGLNKVTDAVQVLGGSALDEMFGIVRDGIEGIDDIGGGIGEIFKGDFKDGFKDIGQGLFDITIGSRIDSSLFFAAKGVEAIQGFAGIEGPARGLTDVEKQALKQVYGDSIDYDRVVIREGDAPLNWGAARTIGNTIYIPSDKLPLSQSLLTHEMGHVWQFQNGGTDYMRKALWAQGVGDGYDFEKGITDGKSFAELNPEQQADLLRKLYDSGFAANPDTSTFEINGVDYSDYAREVLRQVQAGEGAP